MRQDLQACDGAGEGDRHRPAVGGSRGKVDVEVAAGTTPPGWGIVTELGAATSG